MTFAFVCKMVKSQSEKLLVNVNELPSDGTVKTFSDPLSPIPPKIPPRMKKKGPTLPEKPLHMRTNPNPSHTPREPLKPKILSSSNIQGEREILIAASKSTRDKPVEKRQREPAKLLTPTSSGDKSCIVLPDRGKMQSLNRSQMPRKSKSGSLPVLLIPHNMLTWSSAPVSYGLWMQQRDSTPSRVGTVRKEPVIKYKQMSVFEPRSNSVTRSGSLTSQGSYSSDSETFPKSVLKKQKRSSNKEATGSCRKMEHKKNVTFNAFATIQLMEE